MLKCACCNGRLEVAVLGATPSQNERPYRLRVAVDKLSNRDHGLPPRIPFTLGRSMARKDSVGLSDCLMDRHASFRISTESFTFTAYEGGLKSGDTNRLRTVSPAFTKIANERNSHANDTVFPLALSRQSRNVLIRAK